MNRYPDTMNPTPAQIEEAGRIHSEADSRMAQRYPAPVSVAAGPYLAEYKRYDRDQEGEERFATREDAEEWLKIQACYTSVQELTGWINGKRVTATTTRLKYENFAA